MLKCMWQVECFDGTNVVCEGPRGVHPFMYETQRTLVLCSTLCPRLGMGHLDARSWLFQHSSHT